MPQYFSAIRGIAKEEDDPHGRILPNDAAALSYAEFAIAQLQKERGYDVCTGWSVCTIPPCLRLKHQSSFPRAVSGTPSAMSASA